jgi:type I restriction enzyme S subunit
MSEWKKVKLGEIANIKTGKLDSNAAVTNGLYPFFTCDPNTLRINEWAYDTEAVLLAGNNASGNYTAKYYIGKFNAYQRTYIIESSNTFVTSTRFLAYAMNMQLQRLKVMSSGSTTKFITMKMLTSLEIPHPSIETQHRIATILSRYDSLIENYQKQIKLLEEAAQRLYKEWFVELRFPGHENTKMVDGLPEGWERKKLIEFGCSLESGARPKGGVDSNLKDGVPSVGAENVIGLGKYNYSSEKLVTNQFYSQMRKGKIKDRDILIYKDGAYIGRTSLFQDGFPHKEMAVNEHVFLLHTLNENYQYYVFFTLYQKQYFEKMQKLNKNAAQPGLNQKALLDLVMLCPSENFVLSFRKAIEPLMKALFSKANQIRLLTEARDRLLPRLMGGEMEVSN